MYSQSLVTGSGVTLGEALSTGGATTLIGLLIVFSVLIILMIVLMLFKIIFYKEPKKQPETVSGSVPLAQEPLEDAADEEDEDELIAVLTAAVAASLNTSTYKLNIKSFRRIDNNTPAWNRAGVRETINNRF